jgi:hypothetical protein
MQLHDTVACANRLAASQLQFLNYFSSMIYRGYNKSISSISILQQQGERYIHQIYLMITIPKNRHCHEKNVSNKHGNRMLQVANMN